MIKNINKELKRTITLRINEDLLQRTTDAATDANQTVSTFIRQSIIRNINIYSDVEKQVKEQAQRLHKGLSR